MPHCGVMAKIPQASRMAQLPLAEQYAAVELFRGTMVRHSLIAYRDDNPDSAQQVNFNGDAWLGYVPIRMPETICVQERLPPGAAAVLINQSHTYTDLYLPIDSTEKLMFEAVDGTGSIGDIMKRNLSSSSKKTALGIARSLFKRLWLYDQVVLDASQHG